MSILERVKITWTGMPGGPGVTQLYFRDAPIARAALGTWIEAWKYLIPSNTTLTIQAEGDRVDVPTGAIVGLWSGGAPIVKVGTGAAGSYFAGGGACINWVTGTVVAGRRIKGRTFIVPMTALAYDNGTLVDTTVSALQNASTALLADTNVAMEIVRRPTAPGLADGTSGLISAAVVRDKQAVLRSRRD